jgi:hypothetical protein
VAGPAIRAFYAESRGAGRRAFGLAVWRAGTSHDSYPG